MTYDYPRIIQIMPAENIWYKYKNTEDNEFFYCKADCLALVEDLDCNGNVATSIEYIDIDMYGYYELTDIGTGKDYPIIIYSTKDLSNETKDIS